MVHSSKSRSSNQLGNRIQEDFGIVSFSVERVGDDTSRNVFVRLVRTTGRENRDFRKAPTHYREKLKARHPRHIEIGDDHGGADALELQKGLKVLTVISSNNCKSISKLTMLEELCISIKGKSTILVEIGIHN